MGSHLRYSTAPKLSCTVKIQQVVVNKEELQLFRSHGKEYPFIVTQNTDRAQNVFQHPVLSLWPPSISFEIVSEPKEPVPDPLRVEPQSKTEMQKEKFTEHSRKSKVIGTPKKPLCQSLVSKVIFENAYKLSEHNFTPCETSHARIHC